MPLVKSVWIAHVAWILITDRPRSSTGILSQCPGVPAPWFLRSESEATQYTNLYQQEKMVPSEQQTVYKYCISNNRIWVILSDFVLISTTWSEKMEKSLCSFARQGSSLECWQQSSKLEYPCQLYMTLNFKGTMVNF